MGIYSFFSLLIVIVLMYFFKTKIPLIRKIWATTMVKLIGANIKEVGKLNLDANLLVINHNSMFDITLMDYIYPTDIAWVSNIKLANIPVFGYIFKFPNLILIDPKKRSALKVLISRAKEENNNNKVIGIFPEGTRGSDDNIIQFQKGAKLIAEKLNLKVQPIVLVNTRKRLDTKTFRSTAGKIKIIYLDTVMPSSKNWFKDMEQQINDTYKANI
jgi:1-acyl-sn-glycerol-3-phosphate acyltransferase